MLVLVDDVDQGESKGSRYRRTAHVVHGAVVVGVTATYLAAGTVLSVLIFLRYDSLAYPDEVLGVGVLWLVFGTWVVARRAWMRWWYLLGGALGTVATVLVYVRDVPDAVL